MRRAALAVLLAIAPLATSVAITSAGVTGCDSSPARPGPDASAVLVQGPWTRDAASWPIVDAAPAPTIVTETVREPDDSTTTLRLDLYGDYEETRGPRHDVRRGHIAVPELASVITLLRPAFDHAATAPEDAALRGEMRYELADKTRSERYDPQAPPAPVRALHDRLVAVTAPRSGDELEIADCRHSVLLAGGVVNDEPKPGATPPGAEAAKPKRATPSPEAWARFWAIADASGAWRWSPRYASERSSWTGGCARSAHLVHAGRRVDVHAYEAEPPNWDAVQRALQALLEGP